MSFTLVSQQTNYLIEEVPNPFGYDDTQHEWETVSYIARRFHYDHTQTDCHAHDTS